MKAKLSADTWGKGWRDGCTIKYISLVDYSVKVLILLGVIRNDDVRKH